MTEKRVRLLCPSCGSAGVVRDTTSYWDEDAQEWRMSEPCADTMYCADCGFEFREAREEILA